MQLPLFERFRGALLGAELGWCGSTPFPDSQLFRATAPPRLHRLLHSGTLSSDTAFASYTETLFLAVLAGLWHHDRLEGIAALPDELQPIAVLVGLAASDRLFQEYSLLRQYCPSLADELATLATPQPQGDRLPLLSALSALLDCPESGFLLHFDVPEARAIFGALLGALHSRAGIAPSLRLKLTEDTRFVLDSVAWQAWQGWAGRLEFDPWEATQAEVMVLGASGTLRSRPSGHIR